jgi:penicillin-binding protein-related factor A (putative recombinase)
MQIRVNREISHLAQIDRYGGICFFFARFVSSFDDVVVASAVFLLPNSSLRLLVLTYLLSKPSYTIYII